MYTRPSPRAEIPPELPPCVSTSIFIPRSWRRISAASTTTGLTVVEPLIFKTEGKENFDLLPMDDERLDLLLERSPRLIERCRQIRERVGQLLAAVGLADRRRQRPGQLSGGEAQRVALAVALAARPRVLLCDEPTGELDTATTETVLDLLAALRAEEGTTVLTVTHNPRVAERADRRLTMRDGVLIDA